MSARRLNVGRLIRKAEALEESGSINEAIECWRTVLGREPSPVYLIQFARLAMKVNALEEEAEKAFLSVIQLVPKAAIAYEALGYLYRKRGKLKKAEYYVKKSLRIKQRPERYTLLGVIQLDLGKTAAGRRNLLNAVRIDPDYEEAYYNLATTWRDKPTKAIALLRKALALDPNYSAAHREVGWMLRKRRDFAVAEYHIRKAIELDKDDGWAHIYLANLLWAKGDLTGAEHALKRAIEIWPESCVPYESLANFYEHRGRKVDARQLYKRALQLDINNPVTNLHFGLFLYELGEHTKAKRFLERVIRMEPENDRAKLVLAKLN